MLISKIFELKIGKGCNIMKKFGKFLFTTLSLAAIAGGAVYLVKKVLKKDVDEDFDDFEDEFDDFDTEDEAENSDSREYVKINLDSEEDSEESSTKESSEKEETPIEEEEEQEEE